MPFKYCTECGYKNVYTTRQAKFCAGCGESLLEGQMTEKSTSSLRPTQPDLENDATGEIPNIQKLEYTVDTASKNPTIGDLINTRKAGGERIKKKATKAPETLSLKEIEAQSIQECGSSINRPAD